MSRSATASPAALATLALLAWVAPEVAAGPLELVPFSVPLPGPPATILETDLDRDTVQDLVVVVPFTEWDQIGEAETVWSEDVEALVEMLTIVPALFDRRELHVFLGVAEEEGSGYRALPKPFPLDRSVLSLEIGPPGLPLVAMTDEGLSAVELVGEGEEWRLLFEPVLESEPVLRGTANLVSDLRLFQDVDGDGAPDLVFPTRHTYDLYRLEEGALASPYPLRLTAGTVGRRASPLRLSYSLPHLEDVSGDGRPDLLQRPVGGGWHGFQVHLQRSDGTFEPPVEPIDDVDRDLLRGVLVYFGDLDGDGRAELVSQEDLSDEDAGWRKEIREAKRPPHRLTVYRTRDDLSPDTDSSFSFPILGYGFVEGESGEGEEIRFPGGFQDLDGDRRLDLVTLTLDFSLLQAVRVLATKSIKIGLDFHVWCQQPNGSFEPVRNLDLSGKLKLRLDDLRIGRLAQFEGDFDGDGRADFVQLGRGRKVTLHFGQEGCYFPPSPDLTLELAEEPLDLGLVQVRDLDHDGHSDLLVIQPRTADDLETTPPVRLDLYLTREGR